MEHLFLQDKLWVQEDRGPLVGVPQEGQPTTTAVVVVAVDAADRVAAAGAGKATETH